MRRLLLAGSLLVAPPLAAQSGTMAWSIRGSLPEAAAATGGLSEFELVFTFALDEGRIGTQMTVGPTMAAAIPQMDLSSARFQSVVDANGDSVSIGIVLPPEIAAQMGVGIGYRLDMAIPDSMPMPFPAMSIDSLLAASDEGELPTVENTGRTDTVAGVPCEVWMMKPPRDSMPVDSASVTMCMAEPLPLITAISDLMRDRAPGFGFDFDAIQKAGKRFFDGRELIPVMVLLDMGDQQVEIRLMTVSDAAPGPAFFTLPDGLEPFPLDMFMGMMQQAMPQDSVDDTEA